MRAQNIPGFLTKTYEIFSSGEYEDLCSWGPAGDTIIVKKVASIFCSFAPFLPSHSHIKRSTNSASKSSPSISNTAISSHSFVNSTW